MSFEYKPLDEFRLKVLKEHEEYLEWRKIPREDEKKPKYRSMPRGVCFKSESGRVCRDFFKGYDFSGRNLKDAEIFEEDCKGTNFSNCNLEDVSFTWCSFDENTNFEGAYIYGSGFYEPYGEEHLPFINPEYGYIDNKHPVGSKEFYAQEGGCSIDGLD
jgi:hypothetical protein